PVVAGMGGKAPTQTLAVVARGMALGEVTWGNARQALVKGGVGGLGNGLADGLGGAIGVWVLTRGGWALGLILMAAMVINMFVAGTAGTLIPLGLRALKVDPALAS